MKRDEQPTDEQWREAIRGFGIVCFAITLFAMAYLVWMTS